VRITLTLFLERKTEYFAWAKQAVDVVRGSHAGLEGLFDEAQSQQYHPPL
jgi:hypothetical protein